MIEVPLWKNGDYQCWKYVGLVKYFLRQYAMMEQVVLTSDLKKLSQGVQKEV